MKKYKIEMTEEQMLLISFCLEDICRFASGQTELTHTVGEILCDPTLGGFEEPEDRIEAEFEARKLLRQVKETLFPKLEKGQSKSYNDTDFIGNTYQIYRSILHHLAIEGNMNNVYSSPTLQSGNMGTIKIERIEE